MKPSPWQGSYRVRYDRWFYSREQSLFVDRLSCRTIAFWNSNFLFRNSAFRKLSFCKTVYHEKETAYGCSLMEDLMSPESWNCLAKYHRIYDKKVKQWIDKDLCIQAMQLCQRFSFTDLSALNKYMICNIYDRRFDLSPMHCSDGKCK